MTRRNLKAEEIKRKVKIEEILERYGYELNRAGFISCPFHNEKTPSLKIYPETNSYYCFGCNTGGDVISFVMHLLRIDFGSAILRLDNDFCLGLISAHTPRERERAREEEQGRRKEQEKSFQMRAMYRTHYQMMTFCFRKLWRDYLTLRPVSEDEPLNPEFILALHRLEPFEQWLDEFHSFEKWREVYG